MVTRIKVASVRRTFDTIGSVRYAVTFEAVDGSDTVCELVRSRHKSEAGAQRKLEKLITKHGARYADSFLKER